MNKSTPPLKLIDRLRVYEAEVANAIKNGRDVDASYGLLQVLQSSIELCERTDTSASVARSLPARNELERVSGRRAGE